MASIPTTDHIGNKFESKKCMCLYWDIPVRMYESRIRLGWSQKNALEQKRHDTTCYDHLGHKFESRKGMCKYWKIPVYIYKRRIKNGESQKDALEQKYDAKCYYDHLGNQFKSKKAMCNYWKISIDTYDDRIEKGWSTKNALCLQQFNKMIIDHIGNMFPTIREMCKYWNISTATYYNRLRDGYSLEETLILPARTYKTIKIHYANKIFLTIESFEKFYNMSEYQANKYMDTHEKITTQHRFKPGKQITENTTIIKNLDFPYSIVRQNNHDLIWTFDQIISLYHSQNPEVLNGCKLIINDKQLVIKDCIQFPTFNVEYDGNPEIWTYEQITKVA